MPSTLLSLIIALIAYIIIKLQDGKRPLIPPASTPGGEWTRRVAWGMMAIVGINFLADIIQGGYYRLSLPMSVQAIGFAVIVILLPSFTMRKRNDESKPRK